jgi:hypothetical protein
VKAVGPGSVARAWAALIALVIALVWLLPYPVVAAAAPVLRVAGIVVLSVGLVVAIIVAAVIAFSPSIRELTGDDERL